MIKKLLMTVLLAAPLSLAAQKYAYFDYEAVITAMPAYKTAQAEMETISKKYETDFQDMQKEFQTKMEKYQKETTEQTPANIRQRREQELMEMRQKLEQAYEDNSKAIQQESMKKMQPIQLKLTDAINAVAKENNYSFIIDKTAAQATRIFINESASEDVTKKIMSKLGISATTAPAAGTAEKK